MTQPQTVRKQKEPDAASALNTLEHWKNRQMFQYPFCGYDSGLILVPNNTPGVAGGTGSVSSSIITQADDFLVKKIYGFAYGPVNATGLTILSTAGSTATNFPNPI